MSTKLAKLRKDADGETIQAPDLGAAVTQIVSLSAASAATTNPVTSTLVMLIATTACFVNLGDTAALTDVYIPSGVPMYFTVESGFKIAGITSGATGSLYATEF